LVTVLDICTTEVYKEENEGRLCQASYRLLVTVINGNKQDCNELLRK
jgi:hypothetical protein